MAVSLPLAGRRRERGGRPNRNMVLDYRDDLKLFRSWWARGGLAVLALLYWYLPTHHLGDSGLRAMSTIGIYAIGAIGLNLLSGYTGQISLGHAFFIGVGSYTAYHLGVNHELPLLLYLPAAALIGFVIGAVIGPFALRLRGVYLVIVTLGLVFVGRHVFNNWDSVTNGNRGARIRDIDLAIGPLDFGRLEAFNNTYDTDASLFFLVWGLVAVTAILSKNIARSRMGRAMQAVRDRDLSAEVIGVSLARTKIGIFAWSSAFAAVAGVLNGVLVRQAGPNDFGLFMSITFIAIIIIGGVGTIFGPILGAMFVIGGEHLIRQNSGAAILDPVVSTGTTDPGWFTTGELNGVLFGSFIVLFLLFEPRGLAALWLRMKTWLLSWPFSY